MGRSSAGARSTIHRLCEVVRGSGACGSRDPRATDWSRTGPGRRGGDLGTRVHGARAARDRSRHEHRLGAPHAGELPLRGVGLHSHRTTSRSFPVAASTTVACDAFAAAPRSNSRSRRTMPRSRARRTFPQTMMEQRRRGTRGKAPSGEAALRSEQEPHQCVGGKCIP
jgi:hypothetical protein